MTRSLTDPGLSISSSDDWDARSRDLAADLEQGFSMLGTMREQDGCRGLTNGTPSPSLDGLLMCERNKSYIAKKLQAGKVDDAWQTMLQELMAELRKARMDGPFAAPDWWPAN